MTRPLMKLANWFFILVPVVSFKGVAQNLISTANRTTRSGGIGTFNQNGTFSQNVRELGSYLFIRGTVLFVAIVFGGCNARLNREDYVKWVRDYRNDLHVQSLVGDYVFDLQYQPSAYVLLQRGISDIPEANRARELNKMSDIQHYILTISTRDGADLVSSGSGSEVETQQRQYYLSYEFQNDISIEEADGKVLPCVLYHYERLRGAGGGRTIVLGFENPTKNSKEAKVVIRSDLFSALPIKIKVAKSNIPQVTL
jgi:hypothetical protein